MLIDITDSLNIPELQEAKYKVDLLERFESLKKEGRLEDASTLLEDSCRTPHIFHGHYQRLFVLWRQLNKDDLKKQNYEIVIDRIKKAIKYNDEMLTAMSNYWSEINNKKMTKAYFAKSYSHLKVSDGKNLLKAALATGNKEAEKTANNLINSFIKD